MREAGSIKKNEVDKKKKLFPTKANTLTGHVRTLSESHDVISCKVFVYG